MNTHSTTANAETLKTPELDPISNLLAEEILERLVAVIERQNFENEDLRLALSTQIKLAFPELIRDTLLVHFYGGNRRVQENRARFIHLLSAAKLESMGCAAVENAFSDTSSTTNSDPDSDLTSTEAAKLLHVSKGQIKLLAESGQLGELRRTFGGHRRISMNGVLNYLKSSKARR
jgi:excisionase family DNA binding protein